MTEARKQAEQAYLTARQQAQQALQAVMDYKQALIVAWMEEHYPGVSYKLDVSGPEISIYVDADINNKEQILQKAYAYLQGLVEEKEKE